MNLLNLAPDIQEEILFQGRQIRRYVLCHASSVLLLLTDDHSDPRFGGQLKGFSGESCGIFLCGTAAARGRRIMASASTETISIRLWCGDSGGGLCFRCGTCAPCDTVGKGTFSTYYIRTNRTFAA